MNKRAKTVAELTHAIIKEVKVDLIKFITQGNPIGGREYLRLNPPMYQLLSAGGNKPGAVAGADGLMFFLMSLGENAMHYRDVINEPVLKSA